MGCLSGIAKYLLLLFNLLIVLCGVALIAVGAIILVNENKGLDSFTDYSVGGFAIAVGAIIFVISFLGCCGAIKENSCLLTTYAVILVVLLILQVVLGALAFVAIRDEDDLKKTVTDLVTKVFDKYSHHQDDKDQKKIIDDVQQAFECCGVNDRSYWIQHLGELPNSCYKDEQVVDDHLYTEGCADAFRKVVTSNITIIGGVAIGFAVVELLGAVFACIVKNR